MKRVEEFHIGPMKAIGGILLMIGVIVTPMPWQSRLLFLLGIIFYSCSLTFKFQKKETEK